MTNNKPTDNPSEGGGSEQWRAVLGFEGIYEISSLSRVKSLHRVIMRNTGAPQTIKSRIIKASDNGRGYMVVCLTKDKKTKTLRVHRLMAEAFITKVNASDIVVNHKNGIKNDNRLSNLEWCSVSYNNIHALEFGLKISQKGEECFRSKLKDGDVLNIIEGLSDGFTKRAIAKYYNIGASAIWHIANGYTWVHVTGIKKPCLKELGE